MLQRKYAAAKDLPTSASPSKMPTTRMFPLLVRFCLVTVSGLVVCIIPNFSDLMNIIGAVFGTILAFIMPALCHYSLFKRSIRRADLVMDILLVVVGCLGCFLGVIEALVGDTDPDDVIINNPVISQAVALAEGGSLQVAPQAAALKTAASDILSQSSSNNITHSLKHVYFSSTTGADHLVVQQP